MRRGFTLIEILIVTAIVSLLVLALTQSMSRQKEKANDARVKGDLERLKVAMEDYYGDYNCYPPATAFDSQADCGSAVLSPYLTSLPCNKSTGLPYHLVYSPAQCQGYILYGKLQNSSDPQVLQTPVTLGGVTYNYAVGSSNVDTDN